MVAKAAWLTVSYDIGNYHPFFLHNLMVPPPVSILHCTNVLFYGVPHGDSNQNNWINFNSDMT